jgi:hypothetical protein
MPEASAGLLLDDRLDRRLHRAVECRHGRGVDADPGQYPDRYLSRERPAWKPRFSPRTWSTRASRRREASSTCRSRRSPNSSIPGRAACIRCFANARSRYQFRQRHRRLAPDLREIQGFRSAHRAPGLGHQARDQECAGRGLRRRRDDQGPEGAFVRGAARRRVHFERDHGERPLRPDFIGEHHQRRVPHPAQCPHPRTAGSTQSHRLLGRPFDPREEYDYTKKVGYELGCAAWMSARAAAPAR